MELTYYIIPYLIIILILINLNKKVKLLKSEVFLLKKEINEKYNQTTDLSGKNIESIDSIVSVVNIENNKRLDKTSIFDTIYDSVFNDIKSGKIKIIGETQTCIVNNRIGFGGDKRSENKKNINLLFDYFIITKKTNIVSLTQRDWFSIISKLTEGKTKTIDYIYYRDFIQELLDRYKKTNL